MESPLIMGCFQVNNNRGMGVSEKILRDIKNTGINREGIFAPKLSIQDCSCSTRNPVNSLSGTTGQLRGVLRT